MKEVFTTIRDAKVSSYRHKARKALQNVIVIQQTCLTMLKVSISENALL